MHRGALRASLSSAVLVGFPLLAGILAQPARAQAPAPPPVTVAAVMRQDVPIFASGIGTVQAYRSVLVRARVDGTLDKISFREGQDVKPGDAIAEIDPRPYAATLAQARAKRDGDVAQLENARRDLARYATLARSAYASRQQVDTQQALTNQEQANIEADDAAIDAAALNLSFCQITSPIAGVVGLRQVDIGNLIHATDTNGIVTITQVEPISLIFTLPQDQLPAVQDAMQQGAPLVLAYTSDGGRQLAQGKLLTPSNSIDATTGTIALKAEFANSDRHLWPGQFVAARIQLGLAKNAVVVPQSAVQHGPDGLYVYVIKPGNKAAHQDIKVGYQGENHAVVTDGLAGGEDVIVAGQVRVQDGLAVEPHQQAKS